MTTDGDALLAAVAADPADDTVRLAYADWLDENGDPARAEFIRVQVELSSRWCGPCRACGKPLGQDRTADGCPCNSPRGVNHGLVPEYVCTCPECDPEQTGSVRDMPYKVDQLCVRENVLLDAHRRDWLGGPKCEKLWVDCSGEREERSYPERCPTCRGTGYECWPLVEKWDTVRGGYVGSPYMAVVRTDYEITSHFTRGFVSRVELRADQFTEEAAKVIFRHHPTVTEVVVGDVQIEEATWAEDHGFRRGQIVYGASVLAQPRQVWGYITGFVPTYLDVDSVLKWFATREEVLAAFYAACVAWGREVAGLPPLTPR